MRHVLFALLCLLSATALAQGHAHVHGHARLDVVIDGDQLALTLRAPLDSVVGFEHAPRTAAQRLAAGAALKALSDGGRLFKAPAEAGCVAVSQTVESPVLQGAASDGHADLDADYRFRCRAPAALTRLELGLFDALPRLQRLDVQIAGPAGQSKRTLRRGNPTLTIGR